MKIGIVGAGTMGSGIAQVAARAGNDVVMTDANHASLDKSKISLSAELSRLIEKNKLTSSQADAITSLIQYKPDLAAFAGCDLVIEAAVENLSVKKEIFSSLEKITSEETILASNTSSLSITSIAGFCTHPRRVMGIHFFNPATLMPLVEVIPAIQTAADVTKKGASIISGWGKTTVLAKDTPGFIVNRIARPFYGEALRIFEEGIAGIEEIDQAITATGGFRMGPFELMDLIGNDVNYAVTESVFQSFYYDPRYKPSLTQKKMVEAGWLGKKSGRGYYEYGADKEKKRLDVEQTKANEIVERIVVMLINEAYDALYLSIATREDIETAMIKGVNYPSGLFAWSEKIGLNNCVKILDHLYQTYREDRYRCSPLLRKMAS